MEFINESFGKIVDSLYDGLYLVDRNRKILFWNKAAEKISGFTAGEVINRSCSDNILTHVDADGNTLCLGLCPLAASMADRQPREAEVYMHHKDGHRIPISVRVSALIDADDQVIGGIELFTDITNQSANALRVKELEKMALLDRLTQLANRNYIEKEILSRFEEKKRFNMPFGILFMDIDHFKSVNDSYGHDVGDEVLKMVAKTFVMNSRPFDSYGRWGGEEFIGIIRNVNRCDLERIGNRMRLLVENAYILHQDQKLRVTISLGATLVADEDTIDSLIKRADMLLYQSKSSGRNKLTM
jgi:diguanylate cyclase (GGDEF)-like protein/PAS domain S-box-containing protein